MLRCGQSADVDGASEARNREKRAHIKDFETYDPYGRWPMPIKYKIPDGVFNSMDDVILILLKYIYQYLQMQL